MGTNAGQPMQMQTKELAQQLGGHIKNALNDGFSQKTSKPAAEVARLARALRATTRELQDHFSVPLIDKVAEQLEHAADAIGSADAREALKSVERFAQREPLLFVGSALVLGIGTARFLKSTAR